MHFGKRNVLYTFINSQRDTEIRKDVNVDFQSTFLPNSLETSFSILTCSCSNGLMLHILSWTYWPFIYFLWGNNQILRTLSNWVVFLLRFKNYMSWYKSLFIYIICKHFLTFCGFPFHFPYAGFLITKVLNFDQVQFIFSFVAVLLVSYLRHNCIVQGHN